ncbi:DNA methyltransferase 1-associated protein 1, partial [Halocaridina rubra]
MADVRDILELERPVTPEVSKDAILGIKKDLPKKKKEKEVMRRPEGMHRELYALLYSDSNKDLPPLLPSDSGQGYKSVKAKLGMKRVRPWKWMQFTNPARKDTAVLYHWRRACDEAKEYPFAVFNK